MLLQHNLILLQQQSARNAIAKSEHNKDSAAKVMLKQCYSRQCCNQKRGVLYTQRTIEPRIGPDLILTLFLPTNSPSDNICTLTPATVRDEKTAHHTYHKNQKLTDVHPLHTLIRNTHTLELENNLFDYDHRLFTCREPKLFLQTTSPPKLLSFRSSLKLLLSPIRCS
jgi:hypothetical protein